VLSSFNDSRTILAVTHHCSFMDTPSEGHHVFSFFRVSLKTRSRGMAPCPRSSPPDASRRTCPCQIARGDPDSGCQPIAAREVSPLPLRVLPRCPLFAGAPFFSFHLVGVELRTERLLRNLGNSRPFTPARITYGVTSVAAGQPRALGPSTTRFDRRNEDSASSAPSSKVKDFFPEKMRPPVHMASALF